MISDEHVFFLLLKGNGTIERCPSFNFFKDKEIGEVSSLQMQISWLVTVSDYTAKSFRHNVRD